MAGVENVLESPLSPCWYPELHAVPVTVPSSLGSWARGAKKAAAWAWAMPMEDFSHINVGAAGTIPSLDTQSHPAGAPGSRAPPTMGPAGPCGQRELGTSPYLLPWHSQAPWPAKGSQGSAGAN